MATCNVNTLLSSGATFQNVSPREQQIVIAQLLCEIVAAGGGGGGSTGQVTAGTGAPSSTPVVDGAIYIQTDSTPAGLLWSFYGGAWH